MSGWPFDDWLRFAVRGFGLSPDEFWQTSLCDWLVLIQARSQPPLTQAELTNLMKLYPDENTHE
ncbi:MAG TPA: phage tail assembly chaperone [Hellea balneolensis]|uniref:Phage tail assembly chaperone n=1 Tax=Hellea balneolensis TaxID=287478 RepID=A0A7C5LYS9_9PROT|nr:phage tail assembly chaperone [Hellea balneolensis]